MQKIYCLLFAVLFAQASYAASCVSVKQVSANYATKQVTFDVVWTTCTGTHNYKTWVIVDYRTVNANGTKGAWTRAAISGTSVGTLVSASKGVWVTGSASKTQRVTLSLSGMPAKFDWCANALDYPPQAIMSNGTYTLKGTPPFTINGSTTLGANVKTYTGTCVTSVTDVTNNPEGIVTNPAFTAGAIATTGQVVCSGSAYTTIGSTTAASGGDGRITYQWLRNGSVISGATATTYLPTQAGTYTRQAKDGTCNTTWVTSTGSWVVTVVSVPAVPTLSATTTCEGTAITFTAAASGVTGYDWSGAGVTAGSATAATRASTATTAGSYVAQVRSYLTSSGITCFSAYTSNVTGVIVAIPAVPTLTENGPKCEGTAITFTSTAVTGASGYQWAGAGVTASTGTARTATSNATTAGSYVARVRAYITAGGKTCSSAYTSDVTGVIVAIPAVPTLTENGPKCEGTAITFTSTAVTGASGYQWAGAGVTASTGTARTATSNATTAGSYVARVRAYITAGGKTCSSAYTSDVTGVIVDIPNVPTLTATTTCAGTAVTFTASSVSGATGYQWAGTGVAASSGTARTKASNATTAGNYVAQVRSYITASGISCFSAYTSNVTGVIVATPAVPILTQDGPECVGTAITFTTSSVSGATGYQWNGTGVTASSGTARTTTSKTTTAGSYIAQVRAYRTASGITCYSAYTANVTGVINAPGARDAAPHVTCGCVSGLIAVNGYCRNLAADGASSYTGCGVELKLNPTATAVSYSETTCPSGWRLPTATEAKCAYNAVIWRPSNVDYIWTSTVSGCDGGVAGNTHCALHVKDINCYVACYDGPGDYINAGKTWAVPNTHTSGAIYCVR